MNPKEELLKELENLSPNLRKMKDKAEGFVTPPLYFETLEDEIMKKWKADQSIPHPAPVTKLSPTYKRILIPRLSAFSRITSHPKYRKALAFAAGMALLAGSWFAYKTIRPSDGATVVHLKDMADEDLHWYVRHHMADFDAHLLWENSTTEQSQEYNGENENMDAEQYLEENIHDLDAKLLQEWL